MRLRKHVEFRMYGMVNQGIQALVTSTHGAQVWTEICEQAGLERSDFELMSTYDDSVTYTLVGVICAKTGLPAERVLETFGRYWVEFTGGSSYGNLMRLAGKTFIERVKGLDDMHERVLLSMPHLKPPSFELETVDAANYRLHYFSHREGLAPMVVGLLHGLAADTGETIHVDVAESKSAGADHDVFAIRLLE